MDNIKSKAKKNTSKEIICFHCGDLCREDHVVFEEKYFCCNGCKTVYEILKDNDLCNYYDLQKTPGISLKSKDFGEKYNYLDNTEIQDQILEFKDGNTAKVNFYIPVIHCSSCIWLLENLYKLKEGVRYSRVNFTRKEVYIDFNPNEISLKELVTTLTTIGYEPYISLEQTKKKKSINRSLIIKIGVAGFSFGNIMLLSFPEYFGFEGIDDILIQKFIIWLNVLLSIPVVFYCSTDYFKSAFSGLKQKYINIDVPISLGIITLFVVSLFHVIFSTGPGYFDSLAGLLFFLLIGRWIQNKTYEGLSFERDYKSYFPLAVTCIQQDGTEDAVPVKNLKKSDVIRVRNGEIIPADSILISEQASIDYSFVTGESESVYKGKNDLVYAGGRQIGASILLHVQKPVSQSYLTQLWNNEAFKKEHTNEFESLVNRISKYFTISVLAIALLGLGIWLMIDTSKAWFVFTAVLIVACPCALSLSTPFTLGNTMNVFGRNHFYIKNTLVIEKLTHISHIVFDKTGTLTENYSGNIFYEGTPLTDKEKTWVQGLVSNSTHPLSRKILKNNDASTNYKRPAVYHFEERKGKGILGEIEGHMIKIGSLKLMNGDISKDLGKFLNDDFQHTNVFISIDGKVKGSYRLNNLYRKNIDHLIRVLGEKYKFSVLSGDNEGEKKSLQNIFPDKTTMLFNRKPEDKLNFIYDLQQQGEDILMLGDGLNDAGALVKSNVGIAVTEDITSFTPASDAILDGSRLFKLDTFLQFSHTSKKIIFISFAISFLYNLIGMGFAIFGKLTPIVAAILMPASSISVVFFATFAVNTMAKIRKLI